VIASAALGVLLAGAGGWTAAVWPDGAGGGGAAGASASAAAKRSMNPCDVLDNEIVTEHRLTDTGSPGGYDSGTRRVTTCKWATAEFGSPDDGHQGYLTLAYGPASLELVQENRHRYPADLQGLPGAQAFANASEYGSACEVGWPTSFGRVVVFADVPPNVIGGMGCDTVADFARSVFPKIPT
jgi:hypothetical protein